MLLSGSLIKLEIMIDIRNDFAYLTDLTYNSKKSVCFAIGALCDNPAKMSIFLRSDLVTWVDECNYLGVTVSS